MDFRKELLSHLSNQDVKAMRQKRQPMNWECYNSAKNILESMDINGITWLRILFLKILRYYLQKNLGLPHYLRKPTIQIDFKKEFFISTQQKTSLSIIEC